MAIHNYKIGFDQFQIITEETVNGKKYYEYRLKNGKLHYIAIFYSNGQIQNETYLDGGKIISYKFFKENNDNRGFISGSQTTINFSYEINLDENNILKNYKLYDLQGKLTYEGECENKKKSGYGKLYKSNGIVSYQGNWLSDRMHGEGISYHENGKMKHSGVFIRGKQDGFGTSFYENGNKKSEQNWYKNQKVGIGKTFYSNGLLHTDGYFDEDYFKGLQYNENGLKLYQGEMVKNDQQQTNQNFMLGNQNPQTNQNLITNTFQNYVKDGKGDLFYENGIKAYSGDWKNDEFDSFGVLYYKNGDIKYKGIFRNNQYNGFGEKYDLCKKFMCMGIWNANKLERIILENDQVKGYKITSDGNGLIYVQEDINGFRSDYTEIYALCGLRIYEGYSNSDESTNGFRKKYLENEINHQSLQCMGQKKGNMQHGYSYEYHSDGKFKHRAMYKNDDILGNQFRVMCLPNGEINFNSSYKGELYLIEDFTRIFI